MPNNKRKGDDIKVDRNLPTIDQENRYKSDKEREKEHEKEKNQHPINPFETASSPRVTFSDSEKNVKNSNDSTPEDSGQAQESVVVGSEKNASKGSGSSEFTDDVETITAEVVEPKQKSAEKQPIGGHVAPVEGVDSVPKGPETEEIKEDIWDILAQAGITKQRLVYFILAVVGIVFVFIFFVRGCESDVPTDVAQEISVSTEITNDEADLSDAFGIVSSYILGLEYVDSVVTGSDSGTSDVGKIVGVDAGIILGGIPESFESTIVYFTDIIRRMDSMYYTDIYAFLDMSVDRRKALNEYLGDMSALISEAEGSYEQILATMDRFKEEYDLLATERDYQEGQFFIFLENLYGKSAYTSLEEFISLAQDSLRVKSYYNSYKLLADMHVLYLASLKPRYNDVLVNTEALIDGIRVFDIPFSDIEAIIPLDLGE